MKYLGIDYGSKKIGLALSDERGKIAFPHSVIPNDEHAVAMIGELIKKERVGGVAAGDTRTESGRANEITPAFEMFVQKLEQASGMKVELVREHGTSGAARTAGADNAVDAQAAALILERFLDGM